MPTCQARCFLRRSWPARNSSITPTSSETTWLATRNPNGATTLETLRMRFGTKGMTETTSSRPPSAVIQPIARARNEVWRTPGQPWPVGRGTSNSASSRPDSGRSVGKRMTSRIDSTSARIIVSRSMPMPMPPAGGMPYSSART